MRSMQPDFERVETDLAEHIVQLAGETPSHIVWPAMHKTREDVAGFSGKASAGACKRRDAQIWWRARAASCARNFFPPMLASSGANFLIADTGAVCTVTNEGNAELTTTPPRIHIVTAGIEKLVPSIEHAFILLRLLVRSATGGDITQYTTFHCGPKRQGDADGPEEFHIVLVDNGRTRMLAQGLKEMLRCIRCGACMNHCVVYRQIGGHAYGGAYPGPMGSVLTPVFDGLAKSRDLPHACTLNGKCAEVCPVQIPLPSLLRGWRDRSWREGLEPSVARAGSRAGHSLRAGPASTGWQRRYRSNGCASFARAAGSRACPLARGWTAYRDFPAPARTTFIQAYKAGKRGKK